MLLDVVPRSYIARAARDPFFACKIGRMPQYVIERDLPGVQDLTEEQIREISLKSLEVLVGMGPQIRWLHSYVTNDKLYCVYLAPDEATIREHAKRGGFPANRIAAVRRLIDPVNYE
jgi:hypothetical protein